MADPEHFYRVNWRKRKDKEGDYFSVVYGSKHLAEHFLEKIKKDKDVVEAFIGPLPPKKRDFNK